MMQATSNMTNAVKARQDYLVFRVGEREYGVALEKVQELAEYDTVTPLAEAPEKIAGTISVRNSSLPVLNLQEVLAPGGIGTARPNDVVIINDNGRTSGIAVNSVVDVLSLAPEQIRTTLRASDAEEGRVAGIATEGRRVVTLLKPEKLVAEVQAGTVATDRPQAAEPMRRFTAEAAIH
ncbi:MAG TPA: chemotaxis protein CheW [Noviherbaspirillum sp.]|nr:chemotaxis protein CheW [Noviherbaspirillum sp.]